MTSINKNLGLRPAGKRSMMKLPEDRALRAKVTAAKCPQCDRTGAQLSRLRPGFLYCTHCYTQWELPPS
jgi:ribosomal protein L37AE/L43A